MEAADEFRASIKQTYGFDTWPTTRPAATQAATRKFTPLLDNLAEWQLEQRRALPNHQNAYIDHYRQRTDPDVLCSVTIIEFPTVEEAHEGMIDFLTTVMAPTLPTAAEKGIDVGDIGYAGYTEPQTTVSFLRSNIFVRVDSIGTTDTPIKDLAEQLDRHIQRHLGHD